MDVVNQFLNFNKLMGQGLVKIFYFLGIIGILLFVIGGLLTALGTMFGLDFMTGLGMLVAVPIVGLLMLCGLRLACELYVAIFRIADDIAAVRGAGAIPPKV
jgi:hypothetical protein